MNITAEQTQEAQTLILDRLNKHLDFQVPFRKVWAKPMTDMDNINFLMVWALYEGEDESLDIPKLNSFDPYIMAELRDIGIEAIPSISYVPTSEAELLGEPWTH